MKISPFKHLSLLLCLSAMINAEEFELQNNTSSSIKAALGSTSNPPSASKARFLVPGEKLRATISSYEKPYLLILKGDDKQEYQFNTASGQNIKLNAVSSYAGRVDIVPQAISNNVSKEAIVSVGSGSIAYVHQPAPVSSSTPSATNPYAYSPTPPTQQPVTAYPLLGYGSGTYSPQPNPYVQTPPAPAAQPKVSPYALLGVSQGATAAQILGVAQYGSTVKAYRQRSLDWHPDKINTSVAAKVAFARYGITNPEEQKKLATDVFTLISNAYAQLKEEEAKLK
jgi:hypothetical protein